jgi:hypothetical protein
MTLSELRVAKETNFFHRAFTFNSEFSTNILRYLKVIRVTMKRVV